jgi:hypothetical protein
MNAVLWVGIIAGGWLALSVAAGLLLVLAAHLRRLMGTRRLSPAPVCDEPSDARAQLHVVPSLPQQRYKVNAPDDARRGALHLT